MPTGNYCIKCVDSPAVIHDRTPDCHPVSWLPLTNYLPRQISDFWAIHYFFRLQIPTGSLARVWVKSALPRFSLPVIGWAQSHCHTLLGNLRRCINYPLASLRKTSDISHTSQHPRGRHVSITRSPWKLVYVIFFGYIACTTVSLVAYLSQDCLFIFLKLIPWLEMKRYCHMMIAALMQPF